MNIRRKSFARLINLTGTFEHLLFVGCQIQVLREIWRLWNSCSPETHGLELQSLWASPLGGPPNRCGGMQLLSSQVEEKHIMQVMTLDNFPEEIGFGFEVWIKLKITVIINFRCLSGKDAAWIWVCRFLFFAPWSSFFLRKSSFSEIICPILTSLFPPFYICSLFSPPPPTPFIIQRNLFLFGKSSIPLWGQWFSLVSI